MQDHMMNNIILTTTTTTSTNNFSSSSSSSASCWSSSSLSADDGSHSLKAPSAFTAKSWKKLDRHERQQLLTEWLQERGCPPDQIRDLLIFSSNEKTEARRQKKLASYFPEYNKNAYFLKLTPHKMRMYRQAIIRKEKRKLMNSSLNNFAGEGNIAATLLSINTSDPSQHCLEPQVISPAIESLHAKEDENICHHEEEDQCIPIEPESDTLQHRHGNNQQQFRSNTHVVPTELAHDNTQEHIITKHISPSHHRHISSSSNYNGLALSILQNGTTTVMGRNNIRSQYHLIQDDDKPVSERTIRNDGKILFEYALTICEGDIKRTNKGLLSAKHQHSSQDARSAMSDGKMIHQKALDISKHNLTRLCDALENAINRSSAGLDPESNQSNVTISKEEYETLRAKAEIGQNALTFLSKLNTHGGRRGDALQHAFDAVLTSIVSPPDQNMIFIKNDILHHAKTDSSTLQRAYHNRHLLENAMVPSCIPFREVRKQDRRVDNIDDLIQHYVYDFCHDDQYVRIDSNCSRMYRVYIPSRSSEHVDKTMKECHPCVNWANPGKDKDQLDLFLESAHYKSLCLEAASRSTALLRATNSTSSHGRAVSTLRSCPPVSLKKFIHFVCRCVRQKNHASCVDIIQDTVESSLNALKEYIARKTNFGQKTDSDLIKEFEECDCHSSCCVCKMPTRTSLNWVEIVKNDAKLPLLSKVLDIALCPKIEHHEFRLDKDASTFKLRGLKCSFGLCNLCSIDNLPFECPVLSECTEQQDCWSWECDEDDKNKRYPKKVKMQIKDIVKKLRTELKDEAAHDYHLRFQKRMMKIDQETLGEDELLMFTDFAAGIKHTPPKSECCSHEKQSVLDVYVVLTGAKVTEIVNDNGQLENVRYVECDYWFGFTGTDKDGKKNDWVTHKIMVETIVSFYLKKGKRFKMLRLWSDNCPNQYKCRQNFFQLAQLSWQHNFESVEHCFACIYGFKGIWDGLGKIVKRIISNWEKAHDNHAYDAYMCHVIARNTFALDPFNAHVDWEMEYRYKSSKLKDKKTLQCVHRYSVYLTDDMHDADAKRKNPIMFLDPKEKLNIEENKYINDKTKGKMLRAIQNSMNEEHVVFTNREHVRRHQDTNPILGSDSSFYFKVERNRFYHGDPLSDTDEQKVLMFLNSPEKYQPLTSNMSTEAKEFLSNLQTNYLSCGTDSGQVSCIFCKNSINVNRKDLHFLFCQNNPKNMMFPIMHRTRHCFCQKITHRECTHAEICGEIHREDMMERKQSLQRKAVRRVIKHVEMLDRINDNTRRRMEKQEVMNKQMMESIKNLLMMQCRSHGLNHVLSLKEEDVISWGLLKEGDKCNNTFIGSKNFANAAKFLCISVSGTGTNGNVKKTDYIDALQGAGGWLSIYRKYMSARNEDET